MRKLLRELSYHFRVVHTMKAMAFSVAPAGVKNTLLVLHTFYLAIIFALLGDAIAGSVGYITGAIVAGIISWWYFWLLSRDGQQAMEQVEAFLTDEQVPFHQQYPDHVEEVEDGQDPSRV